MAEGQLTPKPVVESGPILNSSVLLWLSLLPAKNEEDPIKNEDARVLTRLYIKFSDTQGQLTPQSVVESIQNINSSKRFWLSSLPARMRKIRC